MLTARARSTALRYLVINAIVARVKIISRMAMWTAPAAQRSLAHQNALQKAASRAWHLMEDRSSWMEPAGRVALRSMATADTAAKVPTMQRMALWIVLAARHQLPNRRRHLHPRQEGVAVASQRDRRVAVAVASQRDRHVAVQAVAVARDVAGDCPRQSGLRGRCKLRFRQYFCQLC